MGYFEDAQEFYTCVGNFLEYMNKKEEIARKVGESGLIIRFDYNNPQAILTIDAKNEPEEGFVNIIRGEHDLKPDISMEMSADTAHLFWSGKLNLMSAIGRGQLKVRGPIQKVMGLLPAIKPAYELYPEYLKEAGFADKIIK